MVGEIARRRQRPTQEEATEFYFSLSPNRATLLFSNNVQLYSCGRAGSVLYTLTTKLATGMDTSFI